MIISEKAVTEGPSFTARASTRAGVQQAMTPMRRGHMLGLRHMAAPPGAAWMAGNPLPFMEYLNDGAADADIHLFPDQAEGHRIPRNVDLDVVIGGDAGTLTQSQIGRANS